jgi:hypothetical protein
MTWGNGLKVLYSDVFVSLRAAAYQVLQYAIRNSKLLPATTTVAAFNQYPQAASTPTQKVIVVTRRYYGRKSRMVASETEDQIVQLFKQRGYSAEVCCDFSVSSRRRGCGCGFSVLTAELFCLD